MGERSSSGGVRNIRAMFEAKNESTTSPPSRGRSPAGSDGARSTSSRPMSKARTSFIAVEKSGAFGPILGLRRMSDGVDANGVANVKLDPANGHLSTTASERVANGSVESLRTGGALTKVKEEEGGTTAGESNTWMGKRSHKAETASRSPRPRDTKILGDAPSNSTPVLADTASIGMVLKGSPFEPLPGEKAPAASKQNNQTEKAATHGRKVLPTNGEANSAPQRAAPAKAGGPHPSAVNTKATAPSGPKSAEKSRMAKSSQPSPVPSLKTPTSVKTPQALKASPKISTRTAPTAKQAGSSKLVSVQKENAKTLATEQSRGSLANRKVEAKANTTSTSSKSDSTRQTSTSTLASGAATALGNSNTSPVLESSGQASKRPRRSSTGFLKPPPKSPTRPVALPASATASTAASAAKTGTAIPSRSPSRASKTDRKGLGIRTDRLGAAKGPHTANALRSKPSRASLEPERPRSSASNKMPDEGFLARMMRPTASSASKIHEKLDPKSPPRKSASQPRRKTEAMGARKDGASGDDLSTVTQDEKPDASMEPSALEAERPSEPHANTSASSVPDDGEKTKADNIGDAAGMSTFSEPIAT